MLGGDFRRLSLWLVLGLCLYALAGQPFVPYESPGAAEWHLMRGKAFIESGQQDHAIEEMRETLGVAPDHIEAHRLLAMTLRRQGRVEEAAAHEAEGKRLARQKATPLFRAGKRWEREGVIARAILAFREAVHADPSYGRAHFKLASLLASQGQMGPALRSARKAVHLEPDNPDMPAL